MATSMRQPRPPPQQPQRSGAADAPTPRSVAANAQNAASTPSTIDPPGKVRFLLEMSERFEKEGNVSEAVKSAETALLLRRSLPPETQSLFATTLAQQAADLVVKCNALGVRQFQNDQYPLAEFILSKALFLTEEAKATNCFGGLEHERLRLRAATFNNLGCLEKRRGQFEASLSHLHKAAEIEALVDPDVGASPSTQLNLCTLLNKMGRYQQAASAAERALRSIAMSQQQGLPVNVAMLLMAHYNLGVSLEFCGRPADLAEARKNYAECLAAGQRHGVTHESNQAMQQAQRAVERIDALGIPGVSGPGKAAGSAVNVARSRDPSVASSEGITPRSGPLRQPPPQARGIMTAPAGGKRDDAIAKHRERIQLRQKRREMAEARSRDALRRAQLAHDREKNEKLRLEQEIAAKQRDELARRMYEQMETGIRLDRIRTLNEAARAVQKVWRGFLVRSHLRDMAVAVVKLQAVVRSYLCRQNLKRQEERAREEAANRQLLQRHNEMAARIQARVRIFLRRCAIVRSFKSRQLRKRHSAIRIVAFYRAYRQRVADRIMSRLEAERQARQEQEEQLHEAARKIQTLYRSYKSRRFMRVVRQEQLRRNAAATKIQAAMRGSLTRAWFKHYRLYRRQQELSTAANLKSIVKIQCAWRVALARRTRRHLEIEKRNREHLRRIFTSARRIQCAWRCFIARGVAFDRRRVLKRRNDAAAVIQRRWHVFQCRRRYLWQRDEARLQKALVSIQRWWRAMVIRRRHVETAKYHARMLRMERELSAKTYLALSITTAMRWLISARVAAERRVSFVEREESARLVQRIGRGGKSREDTAAMRRIAALVARNEAARARANAAACVIQRATRCYQAKELADLKRRQKWAATRVQSFWRMVQAQKTLARLRHEREEQRRDSAARRIQKSVRLFLQRQELKRLDEFYTARRRHKLWEQRRVEAATTIQAHWRGYATRAATAQARQELLQQTVHAIRIQRAWRTHLYRQSINEEVARRQRQRHRRELSATKIQSFWRRVLAAEYVALVRERRFNHTVAVICIQCAWRRLAARRELVRRREIRGQLQRLTAQRHDRWTLSCILVQTVLRQRRDAERTLVYAEERMRAELEHRERLRHIRRCNAATKIQATYRGHYERVYARGIRAEAREKEAARRALEQKRQRAALKIQCAVRSSRARHRVAAMKTAKRLQQLDEEQRREEQTDPSMVVKNLFWAHEAHLKRDLAREREERDERREGAAILMQKIVRGFVYRLRFRRRVREKMENEAAARIQHQWSLHRAAAEEQLLEARRRAAVKIQSVVRMWRVRLQWPERRRSLDVRKSASVRLEERQDAAATRVQATFRGHRARLATRERQAARQRAKVSQIQFEAARMIQKHVRRLLAVNRVTKIRYARMHAPPVSQQQQQQQQASSSGKETAAYDDEHVAAASPPLSAAQAPPPSAPAPEASDVPPPVPPRRTPAPPKVPRPPSGGPSGARRASRTEPAP